MTKVLRKYYYNWVEYKIKFPPALITTAWIYHNATKWVISLSSDWTNWITIADKNLWATQVYNDWDTLSESNCGKYYQWWNNYGFPWTWSVTKSNTVVDASWYWPWNYYSSSTFIIGSNQGYAYMWDSSYNDNLWWWVTWTNEAMQWPCSNWYHIPTNTEWQTIYTIWNSFGLRTTSNTSNTKVYLKLPRAWYRDNVGNAANTWWWNVATAYYWSSMPVLASNTAYSLFISSSTIYQQYSGGYRCYWYSIRPFSNTPIQPDDWWDWDTLYTPPDYLCFTANTAGSTIKLKKDGSPTTVILETSTDGNSWSTYTFWSWITLSNIWDKVYFRNTSETTTGFSLSSYFYQYVMTWSIAASWDVTYLINKNGTDTISWNYCFQWLFKNCSSLTSAPKLLATTLTLQCYNQMFYWCDNLETLPKLPATALTNNCYMNMFGYCPKIKLSTTQTWEYQTPYRIPTTWTWTTWTDSLYGMFDGTWWTFTWTPNINTTYYTSNTLV